MPRRPTLAGHGSRQDDDIPTDVLWALRVACGMTLMGWGVVTLGPVLSAFAHSPLGHALVASWFTCVIGLALGASGAMLITNKLVPLAMTFLLPVSVHLFFQWALLGG